MYCNSSAARDPTGSTNGLATVAHVSNVKLGPSGVTDPTVCLQVVQRVDLLKTDLKVGNRSTVAIHMNNDKIGERA
jgi:hypothetical protein